jgi:hypothetical protein
MNYFSGYTALENANPIKISKIISFATIPGGNTKVINSNKFNNPTSGNWSSSPLTINSSPVVQPTNVSFVSDQIIKTSIMNQQTKMFDSNNPIPFNQRIYVYGNSQNKLDYQMTIPLNFGGDNYNLVQLGIFENTLITPSNSKLIEVFDFGAGPFTGLKNLTAIFSVKSGVFNLGLRLESTTNVSSVFWIQVIVLDPNIILTKSGNPFVEKSLGTEGEEKESEPVATIEIEVDVKEVANSENSTMITRKENKQLYLTLR